MKERETAITNRGPKKRDPACLQALADIDIRIPAGTILRQESGKKDVFVCDVGVAGKLSVTLAPSDVHPQYKRVIA